jgi:divalent metal cation (Fe/Co/Zn/Cd) transporter
VVLLEDTAAMLGLVFAFVGILLAAVTHNPLWDALGTLAIGALLAVVAVVLAVEMHSLLIGEAASPPEQAKIKEAITSTPGISRLQHMRTMYLSPDELLVVGRIEMDPAVAAAQVPSVIDEAETKLRQAVPSARVVYLEPELPAAAQEQPS